MREALFDRKRSVRDREHKRYRQAGPPDVLGECERENLSWIRRTSQLVRRMCEAEQVVIEPGEKIVFTRTIPSIPSYYSQEDWEKVIGDRVLIDKFINNICADWQMALSQGLAGRKKKALETRKQMSDDSEAVEFLDCAVETIDAVLGLVARYAEAAARIGRDDLADILKNVPANIPRSFHEALQSLKIMHSMLWLAGHFHVGLGRFDQYMWPYLEADLRSGALTEAEAEDLLAEFFISLNKDTDLYFGVQRGDNGQSMMLGGVKRDGSNAINPLTYMVLRVSRDVGMIDPKINLRINANTDLELLSLATELTGKGLGFPQYANDDVVISALVAHGYDLEDARDYTVAACWEFIIPGKGREIVNLDALRLPAIADKSIREGLKSNGTFEDIMDHVRDGINDQIRTCADTYSKLLVSCAPYYSVLMDGCIEHGRDLSQGIKYKNMGIHGACATNAADALAAVKELVFNKKSISPHTMLAALEADYKGYEDVRDRLINDAPKCGNNEDEPDSILKTLFDLFADACEKNSDPDGKWIIRPGTGSAMNYVWFVDQLDATVDGRRKGDQLAANLSPAPGIKLRGPISVLQSFSKINYKRICNGGPITMELADTVFRDEESVKKVALLVRTFAQLGCQQLQLNTINRDKLLDAKAHPEKHRDLIVRVWGWSGYFCELASEYQDHVIARHQYEGF